MACGSGSFLIRAYDRLLQHQADIAGMPVERLTQEYRMPLLQNNVFGVDFDPQAVEIARLNLLLRALAQQQLLPSLRDNVKRGNSVIEGNEDELAPYFGGEWREKHPFNWQREFPQVTEDGGFDVVIGNPPYVGFQGFEVDKPYLRAQYRSATGRFDVYMPFIERGLQLLKPGGILGFICPTNFMKRQHGAALRHLLKSEVAIEAIVDFEHSQVFEEVTNYTCILVLRKLQNWFELWNERSFSKQAVRKIVVQEVAPQAKFALSPSDEFYLDTVCDLVPSHSSHLSPLYLVALLNSRLLDYCYKRITVPKANGFYIYKTMFLEQLPILTLDPGKAGEKQQYDRLVGLAAEMLALQEQLVPVRQTPTEEREELLRHIGQVDMPLMKPCTNSTA